MTTNLTKEQEDLMIEEGREQTECCNCEGKFNITMLTKTDLDGEYICEECKENFCDCGGTKESYEVVCRECL